jgi:hypothetical protein
MEYTPEDMERATANAAATREKENIRSLSSQGMGYEGRTTKEEEVRDGKKSKRQGASGGKTLCLYRPLERCVSITAKSPQSANPTRFRANYKSVTGCQAHCMTCRLVHCAVPAVLNIVIYNPDGLHRSLLR